MRLHMIAITEGQPMPGFAELVRDAFSTKGVLAKSRDFEFRPQQQELAVAVAEALIKAESLVAEAGTGVGKSLAYLVPAARFALDTGRKAVISTHTINLQEQLVRKDIPIVRKLLGDAAEQSADDSGRAMNLQLGRVFTSEGMRRRHPGDEAGVDERALELERGEGKPPWFSLGYRQRS